MLRWCLDNDHTNCRREIQKFIHGTGKKAGTVEFIDEYMICQCKKRSCKCYVPAKDRDKAPRRKKR